MKTKNLFIFLLIFLAFVFGCVGGPAETKATTEVATGPINGTVLLNGNPGNVLNLVSGQIAEISLDMRNVGVTEMKNIEARLIGCLPAREGSEEIAKEESLSPNERTFLSWSVQALELGQSEIINCQDILRVCYDTESKGIREIKFLPEAWTGEQEVAHSSTTSDVLDFKYSIGTFRVLKSGENILSGTIKIENVGPGWVDYMNRSRLLRDGKPALKMNHLKSLNITISGEGVKFISISDLKGNDLTPYLTNNGRTIYLSIDQIDENYDYLLKLIQGKELYLKFQLEVTDPDLFQDSPITRTLSIEADHGYCIDVATITVKMRGR